MSVEQTLADQVRTAAAAGMSLVIRGGGSKPFLGRHCDGSLLETSQLTGIVHYEPTELVITARAGTPLRDIESALAERGQMLGFEPPHFGATATIGGTIACGLSGPARPFRGSARDFVLGCKLINGQGEILSFGGEVMKNVAGYDVSRLMCGAYGTLGVLLEVSLKVLPLPAAERYLNLELDVDTALEHMRRWQRSALPLSGLCYDGHRLHVRLSGASKAVEAARHRLGGEIETQGTTFWERQREHQSGFFSGDSALWRFSVPGALTSLNLAGKQRIDWGGALRWVKTDAPADTLFAAAQSADGHAMQFRGAQRDTVFQPLPGALKDLHQRLKLSFDPQRIFNPGRLYADL